MREIKVELERNRVRIFIKHGEDEAVIRLKLNEAEELASQLSAALEDYQKRKSVRID